MSVRVKRRVRISDRVGNDVKWDITRAIVDFKIKLAKSKVIKGGRHA